MLNIETGKMREPTRHKAKIFHIFLAFYLLALLGSVLFLTRATYQKRTELVPIANFENTSGFLKLKLDDSQSFLTNYAASGEVFLSLKNDQQAGFPPVVGKVMSGWFIPPEYISVPVVGPSYRQEKGGSAGFDISDASITLECRATSAKLGLLNAFNMYWYEKVISVPSGWCPGEARLVAEVYREGAIIGIGAPAKVDYLFYLAATKFGYLAWGLLGSAFVSLLFAPFLVIARLTPLERLGLSIVYSGLYGYGLYFLANKSYAAGVLVICAVIGLVLPSLAISGLALKLKIDFNLLAKWTLGLVAAAVILVLVILTQPLVGGPWFSNDLFYPVTWSTDNHLPALMAKYVLIHGAGHPPALGPWSVTDRGFGPAGVLVGVISLLRFSGLYEYVPNSYIPIYITGYFMQAVAISFIFIISSSEKDSKLNIFMKILFIFTIPFILFNLIYTWVKLMSGVSVIVAALLGASVVRSGSILSIFLAFLCYVVALITHSASLLAAPLVGLFVGYVLLKEGGVKEGGFPGWLRGRCGFRVMAACVGAGLISAGLLFLHDSVAAKTTYGTMFVLTGEQRLGLNSAQARDIIFQYFKNMTIENFVESRLTNFFNIFWPFNTKTYVPSCKIEGFLACLRASQFLSVGPALGVGVLGLCLVGPFGVKYCNALQRDIRTFAAASMIWMFIILFAFGMPFIVILLPYALLLALVLLALVNLSQTRPAIAVPLLVLQIVNFGWVWILGARGVWSKFGF
ncbi:hypothetical protein [Xanthobacter sp. VNH20]|uniref:hypothetical protein n=1 Tax=Xanthobacter sp. VNH20 TaxID=3156616 RepID=UPI0032B36476